MESYSQSDQADKASWWQRAKHSLNSSHSDQTIDAGRNMHKAEDGSDTAPGEVVKPLHKKVNWFQATLILIAETVSLGILSLPASVADMGLVPGAIVIVFFGAITLATGFMIFHFRMRYPHVTGFGDAGYVIAGTAGAVIAEVIFQLLLVFISSAHILTFSTMARTIAGNSWKCTVVFKLIAFFISLVCTLPRSFNSNSYLSAASCLSILAATLIAMIDIAIEGEGLGLAVIADKVDAIAADWMMSLSNIMVSFVGHLAHFAVMAEMENPEDFPKSLVATSIFMSSLYLIVAIVVYYYAGPEVGSPALSSADPLFAKIAYGIATPTIVVAGVIAGLLACKRNHDWFWRLWKKQPKVVEENSFRAWASWVAIVIAVWALAFVLSNVIPFFSPLLAFIGAISATWICLGIPAMGTMYMCHHGFAWTETEYDSSGDNVTQWKARELVSSEHKSSRWYEIFTFPPHGTKNVKGLWVFSILTFILAWVMVGFGLYGSVQSMITQSIDGYSPFSCNPDP